MRRKGFLLKVVKLIIIGLIFAGCGRNQNISIQGKISNTINDFQSEKLAVKKAKYVILLIGDGMGYWHIDATRKYLNKDKLAMETLANFGYMTTFMRNSTKDRGIEGEYWDDSNVVGSYDPNLGGYTPWEMQPVPAYVQEGATDSAAAGSALASGHKTVKCALNVVASRMDIRQTNLLQ